MTIGWAVLLVVVALVAWLTNFFGLPGNWLIVGSAAAYAYFAPASEAPALSWWIVGILTGIAVVGEIVEFLAGARGVKRAGGSRRAGWWAIVGSMLGALLGMVVGIPVPVVGSILAALLFASAGALTGAVLAETSLGRPLGESLSVGHAAFWSRMLGTLAKALLGGLMVLVLGGALFLPLLGRLWSGT